MKNKVTAAVLAFFLGGLGIHRFYLGQGGLGVAYLLFSWTVIPFFIAFLDSIILILMSDQSFDRKYNYLRQAQNNNNMQTTVVNNVYSAGPPITQSPPTVPVQNDQRNRMDALERLFELRQKGVLSELEFEKEKAKLLGNDASGLQKPSGGGDPFLR